MRHFGFFDCPEGKDLVYRSIRFPIPEKSLAIEYLSHGHMCGAVPGTSIDVFTGKQIGPPHVMTDGEWLWTLDVVYYFREYDLRLPDDFLVCMHDNGWVVPESVDLSQSVNYLKEVITRGGGGK